MIGVVSRIDVARQSCSASIARAIICGHVMRPKAISQIGVCRSSSPDPFAAPIIQAAFAHAMSRASGWHFGKFHGGCLPGSSGSTVTKGVAAGEGQLPPVSGSSVMRVGHTMRLQ